ncbi:MAG: hypothetical protein WKF79_07030 [Nocardioides sp.]
MYLDTELPGDPASFHAAAAYVRQDLGHGAENMAARAYAERSSLASAWTGEGGEGFQQRASGLGVAADEFVGRSDTAAAELEALASVLFLAQLGLLSVRTEAVAAGLFTASSLVFPPVWGGDQREFDRLTTAWNVAVETADRHLATWADALENSSAFFQQHAVDLVGITVDLMVGAYSGALLGRLSTVMAAEAIEYKVMSRQLADHAADFLRQIQTRPYPGDLDHYDNLIADSRAAADKAADTADSAANPRLPKELRGGLGALGVLATGYGVYDDIQSGESTEQAVVSQGGGLLAGVVAGAGTGAVVGTVFPGVGTVTLGILGGIAGGVAAIATDQAIDSAYENGNDPGSSAHDDGDSEALLQLLLDYESAGKQEQPGG